MTAPAAAAVRPRALASIREVQRFWLDALDWLVDHWFQIAIAAAIGTAMVLAMLFVRRMATKLCARHDRLDWRTVLGRAAAHTGLWFMVLLAARLLSGSAEPPQVVARLIGLAWTIAATVQVAIWVRELVIGFVEQRAVDHDHGTLGSAIGLIRLMVSLVLFAIATVVVLDNLGVNVTGLVAGLGIGGIAIGLAAKGIFDDLFSALSIIFDKPFRRGDSIRWDSTSGTVEAIGLKTTRVRATTGEEVVISNTNILNKQLHNLARLARRRNIVTVGLTYETPVGKLEAFPDLVRALVEREEKCKLVRCGMAAMGASSLDYEVQFDVMSDNYDEVFNARHKVLIGIVKMCAEEGIGIAYPTQVTYTAAPDGTLVMPYADGHSIEPPRLT
ncbi:MAG: mechanosensitive ion channel family protein [Sphingomonas fennica]